MFESAGNKLEDTRTALGQLDMANDAPTFRAIFNAFLGHARAVTYALQRDGGRVPGFKEWYEPKQAEMKADELLRFIHDSRIEDFHKGKHQLTFATYVDYFSLGDAGPPPSPNATFAFTGEGPFWVVDAGTPRERRIPVKRGGTLITQVMIANPPRTHRGAALERIDPRTICTLALTYLEDLVHAARTQFTEERK